MKDKTGLMGNIGEKIIADYCESLGLEVIIASSPFDSEKDMIVDGLKVEVKTMVPWIVKNAFTVKPSQLRKLYRADRTFFISVPNRAKNHFSDGKVYRVKDGNFKVDFGITKDGRTMCLISINQLEEVFALSDRDCTKLQNASISEWNSRG